MSKETRSVESLVSYLLYLTEKVAAGRLGAAAWARGAGRQLGAAGRSSLVGTSNLQVAGRGCGLGAVGRGWARQLLGRQLFR